VKRALIELVLLDEEHPEGIETEIAERELVALVVLAETAGAAGARGHVDVLVGHALRADALRLGAQEIRQVSGGEARRAALADIGQLATEKEIALGGGW